MSMGAVFVLNQAWTPAQTEHVKLLDRSRLRAMRLHVMDSSPLWSAEMSMTWRTISVLGQQILLGS
jgi:hypothetical protein